MAEVTIDQLKYRFEEFERRRKYYEWKSENTRDRLERHEVWRHTYDSFPYLIGAPDERVACRFKDVFINMTELNRNNKIGVLHVKTGERLMQKYTHLLEEYEVRGDLSTNVIENARRPILKYFENGGPVADKIFGGYSAPSLPFYVKYGRREFLEPMMCKGEIRICPASFYNNQSLIESICDDEITRSFFIPTFRERLKGEHSFLFQGLQIDFGNDDIYLPVISPDYYFFSLCNDIYYRMPTDFNADSALIIHNPPLFTQLVISNFLAQWPEWEPIVGPITYYDPYRDYSKLKTFEMSKHFSYSYQREVRIALISNIKTITPLHPRYIKIGPMMEYAELLSA